MTTIIPIPAFTDNYIWLLRDGGSAVVVDPGDEDPVLAYLGAHGLALTAILTTHHHPDHVGGVAALLERYPVPVFGPGKEKIPGRTHVVGDGTVVPVPGLGLTLTGIDVPGHTAGHIAYFGEVEGVPTLFCGDTLFAGGCGRLFEGTPEQMWASLSTLARLPAATRVYCAHEYTLANLAFALAVEPDNADLRARQSAEAGKRARGEPTVPSTIGIERATNPFLRAALPGVRAAAERRAGRALPADVDAFAELREWKNTF
ncbi:MAG: hydroxyacylglutathione hydrolase [Betaproteobacteria bacterium]|nr:hydroxyacylglutathione hydrolase [Betaproteobacteria bacterium]MCC7216363.1 hydroxyacylglutathione hydrolase [Burkholderiales bacterium]